MTSETRVSQRRGNLSTGKLATQAQIYTELLNQSINQSINQPINQSINPSID